MVKIAELYCDWLKDEQKVEKKIYLKIGPNWQCCLAGNSKTATRIFIFLIVLGAEYLYYVKSIETHVGAFLPLDISAIGTVCSVLLVVDVPFSQNNWGEEAHEIKQ